MLSQNLKKFVYKLANIFTLETIYVGLVKQYYDDGLLHKSVMFGYFVFLLGALRCFLSLLYSFVEFKNLSFDDTKIFLNYLVKRYVAPNSLVLLGIETFVVHTFNVVHYCLYQYIDSFPDEVQDIYVMIRQHIDEQFTCLPYLLRVYSKT